MAPDGRLVVKVPEVTDETGDFRVELNPTINVHLNWFDELRRLTSTGGQE